METLSGNNNNNNNNLMRYKSSFKKIVLTKNGNSINLDGQVK